MSSFGGPQVQGWLLKQRHGIRKTWVRRYFILEGNELRYYKNQNEPIPHNVLHLDQYQVVTDCVPLAVPHLLKKQPTRHQYTFLLLSNDKNGRADLSLQAETKEELDLWINAMQQQQLNGSTSVLDKWLERLDMHANSSAIPPPMPHMIRAAGSSSQTSLLSPQHQQQPQQQQQQQQRRSTLRGHRSSESLASSLSSTGSFSTTRSSFGELRRTSNQSTISSVSSNGIGDTHHNGNSKFLANLFHHWTRPKLPAQHNILSSSSSSPGPAPSASSSSSSPPQQERYIGGNEEQEPLVQHHTPNIIPVMPIIHPSEYNKCYKDYVLARSPSVDDAAARPSVPVASSRSISCSSFVISSPAAATSAAAAVATDTDVAPGCIPRILTSCSLNGSATSP